jgi:ParB-like chromosome segregation protein Spo0J
MTKMLISQISVGDRRREDLGDVAGLATSINRYGLLHPVVVDATGALVAGERRLRATESLGESWIEVKQLDELSDAELREIELEENLRRKDLTPFESARVMVERVGIAREIESTVLTDSVKTGRPPKSGISEARIAERTGIPRTTARDSEAHVETAEAFPVFQKPDWRQYHVLEAREALNKLPEPERPKVVALIDQPGIPPKDAIQTLANVAAMPEQERHEILRLAESPDSRDRSRAITTAARKPAMPDPRWTLLLGVSDQLKKCARLFPDDPFTSRIRELAAEVEDIAAGIKEEVAA